MKSNINILFFFLDSLYIAESSIVGRFILLETKSLI
jgi:hypothetical protein